MRCDQIREYLSAYLEDDLEPGLRLNIEQHLEDCDGCRSDLDAIREVYTVLDAPALLLDAPSSLHQGVMRRLRVEQREKKQTIAGWYASLSRGWQAATAGACAVAVMMLVIALGPLQSGMTGGVSAGFPWSRTATSAVPPVVLSVAGTTGGFQAVGIPDSLLLDLSAPRDGHWRMSILTSPGVSLSAGGSADPAGGTTVWQGDLSAGNPMRVPLAMTPSAAGSVQEISVYLSGPNSSAPTHISVLLPVQTAATPGAALQWHSSPQTTLHQALTDLAALTGAPISVPSDALNQTVTVNASGLYADDLVSAVAGAAGLKVDRTQGAYNLHR